MCLILYNEYVVKVTLTLEADVFNLYLEMRKQRLSRWLRDLELNTGLARPCSRPPCWLLHGDSELHARPSEGSSPQIPTVSLPFQLYPALLLTSPRHPVPLTSSGASVAPEVNWNHTLLPSVQEEMGALPASGQAARAIFSPLERLCKCRSQCRWLG